MDYHVQIHRVADITNREALDAFVARLHASRLDPDKPLWQYHFIFDDNSETFAIYARVHHMYGDGATLVRWFQAGYVSNSHETKFTPVWAVKRLRHKRREPVSFYKRLVGVGYALKTAFDLVIIFIRIFMKVLRVNPHYMPIPFTGTKTVLTGQVKAGRAVATMDIDFKRVKALARRTRSTANVGLVCCNKNIESLQPLARYVKEAFDMLEASVDDPRLNIDDIGEQVDIVPVSIVSDH